ncbi:MAG: hypothetical protein ABW168_01695, partial [Sedimenticola sp.]
MGKDSRVYAQIAVESRQRGRLDHDVLQSLIELQKDMYQTLAGGFIQKICASPCYILYWSEPGLRLYNERADKDALFWDATGSVVRRRDDGKQFLYYELAIRHPVKGKMGIPVTAMLSVDQSLSIVLDWICSFRQAEKRLFGHNKNKLVIPKMIISDQAMVFLLAALKEFNGESLETFLSRAWQICEGTATVIDAKKTLVHFCASHFMNTAKRYMKKKDIAEQKLKIFMYMIGLLMNSQSIRDAHELLFDIYAVVGSNYITQYNREFYDRILRKINNFQTTAEFANSSWFMEESSPNDGGKPNPNLYTEEDFQVIGSSTFKDWSNSILEKAAKFHSSNPPTICDSTIINSLHSTTFAEYLKTRLMPIFPIWSGVLMGDLSRYNKDYLQGTVKPGSCNAYNSLENVATTNSTIENRFRILKHVCLGGRTQHRLDEFSESLKSSTVGVQKLVALDCLKYPVFTRKPFSRKVRHSPYKRSLKSVKNCQKKNILVEEQWNKPRTQSLNLLDKQGKYQKAPSSEIKLKETSLVNKI